MGHFYKYSVSTQVVTGDHTIQCKHMIYELWLYIAAFSVDG